MRFMFGGVVNMHDPGKLGGANGVMFEQVCADNTEISARLGGRRRLGRNRLLSGRTHSGWNNLDETIALFVQAGVLKRLEDDGSATAIKTLSNNDRMCYTEVNHAVFCSNGTDKGIIEGGEWYDLAEASERFKETTPAAKHLTFYRGSVYGAIGSVITVTDPYNMEVADRRLSKIPIPGVVGMLQAVDEGIWLSTGREIVFLSGTGPEDFQYRVKANYPAIPYAYTVEYAERLPGVEAVGKVAVFGTVNGICLGTSDGRLLNLSREKVSFNPGVEGTIIVKERDGQTHILLSTDGTIAAGNAYEPKAADVETPALIYSEPDNSQYLTIAGG